MTSGGSVQLAWTFQTLEASSLTVEVDVIQNKAIVATLFDGTIDGLETNSLYLTYLVDASTLPTLNVGPAELVASGSTTSVALTNLLVVPE